MSFFNIRCNINLLIHIVNLNYRRKKDKSVVGTKDKLFIKQMFTLSNYKFNLNKFIRA